MQHVLDFDGPSYSITLDRARLTGQLLRIVEAMKDGQWRTLEEIKERTRVMFDMKAGDPTTSISAQLRHLRKPRFGSHTVDKRRRGDPGDGLYEYSLRLNQPLGGRP